MEVLRQFKGNSYRKVGLSKLFDKSFSDFFFHIMKICLSGVHRVVSAVGSPDIDLIIASQGVPLNHLPRVSLSTDSWSYLSYRVTDIVFNHVLLTPKKV